MNRLRVVPGAAVVIDADPVRRARKDAAVGAAFFLACCGLWAAGIPISPTPLVLSVLVPSAQVLFRLHLDLRLTVDPAQRRLTRRFFGREEVLGDGITPGATVRLRDYGRVARADTPRRERVTGWGVELVDGDAVLVVNAQSEVDARLVADTLRQTLGLAATA